MRELRALMEASSLVDVLDVLAQIVRSKLIKAKSDRTLIKPAIFIPCKLIKTTILDNCRGTEKS